MLIAVPTGVKIFNWIGTLCGSIEVTPALLFSIAFIGMFVIGGLSGVTHAAPPSDAQQQDTYYVVAHFHYVLFGGALLGLWSEFIIGGQSLQVNSSTKIGYLHFTIVLIGFNITFFPMHWLGLDGMPRRIATYPESMGWEVSNLVASLGSFILGFGVLVFLIT